MRFQVFLRLFGSLLKLLAVVMLLPGAVAAYYGETQGVLAFALTSLLTLVTGIALGRLGSDEEMGQKEGFALVALGWLGAALFGALPYLFLGLSPLDSFFESMSGFTTTGSSILTEANSQGYYIINPHLANQSLATAISLNLSRTVAGFLPPGTGFLHNLLIAGPEQTYFGLLFWRSFSQWLGGMGIILLFIAILPRLGVAGRQLYKAEVPGPDKDTITPRIRQTARILWVVYVLLTAIEVGLLFLAGMPLYDAFCNTFATMATGGFSPQLASIASYRSATVDGIITLFMFLAGANFVLHYRTLYRDRRSLIDDTEFRFYALIIIISTAAVMLWGGLSGDLFIKFRYAVFQIVSIITTTGFATADFDSWTTAAKYVLLLLMFIGACAGSTGGAMKVVRVLLMLKSGYRELFNALHPKAVLTVRLAGEPVRDDVLRSSNVFVALYITIFAVATLLLAVISFGDPRMDIATATSAVATTLGNVGPGFGMVGPNFSFADVHPLGKMLLIFCMWIGRLEVITVLVLLLPEFWKK
ncbi:MAG: TrkH family potassium uptake protein [Methanotrichaceae archaeon]|nr:TrkH family potassium uptake protein [Methanotrichaceae archaeon]